MSVKRCEVPGGGVCQSPCACGEERRNQIIAALFDLDEQIARREERTTAMQRAIEAGEEIPLGAKP